MKKHNAELTYYARELRKNMTPQEKKLWYGFLRTYPTNFLKQKVIGSYIVDFYCSKAKLAVEIDGKQHEFSQKANDLKRNKDLEILDISTLRFSNSQIEDSFEECCKVIDKTVKEKMNK